MASVVTTRNQNRTAGALPHPSNMDDREFCTYLGKRLIEVGNPEYQHVLAPGAVRLELPQEWLELIRENFSSRGYRSEGIQTYPTRRALEPSEFSEIYENLLGHHGENLWTLEDVLHRLGTHGKLYHACNALLYQLVRQIGMIDRDDFAWIVQDHYLRDNMPFSDGGLWMANLPQATVSYGGLKSPYDNTTLAAIEAYGIDPQHPAIENLLGHIVILEIDPLVYRWQLPEAKGFKIGAHDTQHYGDSSLEIAAPLMPSDQGPHAVKIRGIVKIPQTEVLPAMEYLRSPVEEVD